MTRLKAAFLVLLGFFCAVGLLLIGDTRRTKGRHVNKLRLKSRPGSTFIRETEKLDDMQLVANSNMQDEVKQLADLFSGKNSNAEAENDLVRAASLSTVYRQGKESM
ncbi:uncharacterized protein LOC124280166 [Haliotis rubra]|uniref:uncharacterized protein LOC124280166 n=1 Tax=Haliotis rubra TaxID=36100 RepID=UPI001EE58872|nr:uncharacterized protein LOC124280166 [Haliotis rubra]